MQANNRSLIPCPKQVRDIRLERELILSNKEEFNNAMDYVMDCLCDNMDYDDALEVLESMSNLSIASKTAITYGCDWSKRGPMEYRRVQS